MSAWPGVDCPAQAGLAGQADRARQPGPGRAGPVACWPGAARHPGFACPVWDPATPGHATGARFGSGPPGRNGQSGRAGSCRAGRRRGRGPGVVRAAGRPGAAARRSLVRPHSVCGPAASVTRGPEFSAPQRGGRGRRPIAYEQQCISRPEVDDPMFIGGYTDQAGREVTAGRAGRPVGRPERSASCLVTWPL